jgi:hypothetical protein
MRDELGKALLEQLGPAPGSLEPYRRKVAAMIEKRERDVRRDRWVTGIVWATVVLLATSFNLVAGFRYDFVGPMKGLWLAVQACFWLLFGAVLLLRHFAVRNHVELLKELKGLEMRVIEIQEHLARTR